MTLFTRELELYNSSSIIDRMMIDALFAQTLLTVGGCAAVGSSDSTRATSRTLERMKRYIAENYTEKLTPELLLNSSIIADYLGFSSVYYFSRLFKRRFLVSPTAYVKAVADGGGGG